MSDIVVFHSVFGLRPVERLAADVLRSAGYDDADLPDHDEQATTLTWQRILPFLHTLTH